MICHKDSISGIKLHRLRNKLLEIPFHLSNGQLDPFVLVLLAIKNLEASEKLLLLTLA